MRPLNQMQELSILLRKLILSLLLIQCIAFILIAGTIVVTTSVLKKEIALQISQEVRRSLLLGDIRNTLLNINKAVGDNFTGIGYSKNGLWQFSIPSITSRESFTNPSLLPRLLTSQIKTPIFFDENKHELMGLLHFKYSRFQSLLYSIPIWFFFIILSIPLVNRSRKKLIYNYQRDLDLKAHMAMSQLTKHLSHDVRRPLSQVKVILDAFDMFKSNPSRLENAKLDVKNAISNIESMLSEVMDYSRETKLETSPKSLGGILDFVIRQVGQGIADIDISFKYTFRADYKPLMDEDRFSRVLSNIIGNGIEAITVIGKKKHGVIAITTSLYKDNKGKYFTELIIGNDGPLFPEGVEDKLFESFFTSGKSKGTGLGLASAKKIVQLHDGSIFARNKADGNGVEFIIRLPVSEEREHIDKELLPQHSSDLLLPREDITGLDVLISKMEEQVFKVVLLEDEALYRAWIKNLIQGNETLQKSVVLYDATTVEEALQLVAKEKPTHAIVDIDLGAGKDGYDFLAAIKGDSSIKSIVHSNRTLEEFREKAKDLGASGFVPKPLPLSSLVEFLVGEKIQTEKNPKHEKSKVVYCCDDTRLIRDHLDFILGNYLMEKPGAFEFEIFINGEELIKKAREVQPVLVLSDLNMREAGGQLNGYEVIKAVKGISRQTKAYLISNEPSQLSEGPTREAGGDGALEQPLNKELLYPILDKIFTKA